MAARAGAHVAAGRRTSRRSRVSATAAAGPVGSTAIRTSAAGPAAGANRVRTTATIARPVAPRGARPGSGARCRPSSRPSSGPRWRRPPAGVPSGDAAGRTDVTAEAGAATVDAESAPRRPSVGRPASPTTAAAAGGDEATGTTAKPAAKPRATRKPAAQTTTATATAADGATDATATAAPKRRGHDPEGRRRPPRRPTAAPEADRRGAQAADDPQDTGRLTGGPRATGPARGATAPRVEAIAAMIRGGTPHAVLISGPAGVGKTTLALDLAAGLLCQAPEPAARPCRACRGCRLVEAGVASGPALASPRRTGRPDRHRGAGRPVEAPWRS